MTERNAAEECVSADRVGVRHANRLAWRPLRTTLPETSYEVAVMATRTYDVMTRSPERASADRHVRSHMSMCSRCATVIRVAGHLASPRRGPGLWNGP